MRLSLARGPNYSGREHFLSLSAALAIALASGLKTPHHRQLHPKNEGVHTPPLSPNTDQ